MIPAFPPWLYSTGNAGSPQEAENARFSFPAGKFPDVSQILVQNANMKVFRRCFHGTPVRFFFRKDGYQSSRWQKDPLSGRGLIGILSVQVRVLYSRTGPAAIFGSFMQSASPARIQTDSFREFLPVLKPGAGIWVHRSPVIRQLWQEHDFMTDEQSLKIRLCHISLLHTYSRQMLSPHRIVPAPG